MMPSAPKLPGAKGPRGRAVRAGRKVRRLIHGVQQKERAAFAAVGKLAQRACRRAHLVRFEQQDRAGEQIPGGVLEDIGPHLLLELVGQGKKAVLVFQASEG